MKKTNKLELKGYTFKSQEEYYFALYLEELVLKGFVKWWGYEITKFELSPPVKGNYTKQLKTKSKPSEEHLLGECTYQPDFTFEWLKTAENVFYLNPDKPVGKISEIPFRCTEDLISHVDVKAISGFKTPSGSISFPVKQKWVMAKFGIYVQKIIPFSSGLQKTLFRSTFYPQEVIKLEVYKTTTKFGKRGASKIKGSYRSLDEYLKI